MSSPKDIVLQQLKTGRMLIEKLTADMTDEEYFIPAAKGTNHAGWIMGHVAQSEDWMIAMLTDEPRAVSEDMQKLFNGASECQPDASRYPARKVLDTMFQDNRARAIEAVQNADDTQWDDPSPHGDLPQAFFPTVGSIWGMMGSHQFWHIGQLTTCRAALKKDRVLG